MTVVSALTAVLVFRLLLTVAAAGPDVCVSDVDVCVLDVGVCVLDADVVSPAAKATIPVPMVRGNVNDKSAIPFFICLFTIISISQAFMLHDPQTNQNSTSDFSKMVGHTDIFQPFIPWPMSSHALSDL